MGGLLVINGWVRRFILLSTVGTLFLYYYYTFGFGGEQRRLQPDVQMAALQPLKTLVIKPLAKHTSTVIFMHGLGDTGDGWEAVATMLSPDFPGTKWVLPHAPVIPITCNGGFRMPGWYDIVEFGDINREEDESGMLKSVRSINELLTAEVDAGIESKNIVLGGFSQGAVMALLTALTGERKVAGIISMSGYLPLRNKMKAMMSDHARKLPIFWGHGTQDPVVQFKWGEMSVDFLQKQLKVENLIFKSYPMGHSAVPEEINDVKDWLSKHLPSQ
ncbi:hypothetical protein FRC02_001849 [Tulasnella sp. 418]|nr:hypothetical protein FRC02_001849 [Tulasnella sp. 418]